MNHSTQSYNEPNNFSFLEKNIAINRVSNVVPINVALSDRIGKRDFFLEKYNKGHHSFAQNQKSSKKIEVNTETLDESLKKFGSPPIGVIKMDIEGAEPIALRGMADTLARNPKVTIFTEIYPRSIHNLGESALAYLEELRRLGFILSLIDEDQKKLIPVNDFHKFLDSFPKGESFKNLYAVRAGVRDQSENPA